MLHRQHSCVIVTSNAHCCCCAAAFLVGSALAACLCRVCGAAFFERPPFGCCSQRPCCVFLCAQFITVFLGSFIAGSVLNQASTLFKNPASIINILGTSAPLTSIFFLTYIELNVRGSPGSMALPLCPLLHVNRLVKIRRAKDLCEEACRAARLLVGRKFTGSLQECIKSSTDLTISLKGCQCLAHGRAGCCLILVLLQVQTTG